MIHPSQSYLSIVDQLNTISLSQLQAVAEFLTRRDRKYIVPEGAVASLLTDLEPSTSILEIDGRRSFGYLTPYFDDDAYSSYLRSARGRPNRFKIRTRLYTDSGLCMLELKLRDARGKTIKHRTEHAVSELERLDARSRLWLCAFPEVAPFASQMRHHMSTVYDRVTLVLPERAGRITIDRNLSFERPDGEQVLLPSIAIIETKGPGAATSFDRALWRNGYRPVSMSKFAAGMGLLHPELPANRWHRTKITLSTLAIPSACDQRRISSATPPSVAR